MHADQEYKVKFREDWSGKTAHVYHPCTVRFSGRSNEPFIHFRVKRTVSPTDIKIPLTKYTNSLSSTPPRGHVLTLSMRSRNQYLKFDSPTELKEFHAKLLDMQKNICTSLVRPSILGTQTSSPIRRSPRTKKDGLISPHQDDNKGHNVFNGSPMNLSINERLPSDIENLCDENINLSVPHLTSGTSRSRNSLQSSAAGAVEQAIKNPFDKENQPKTPTKLRELPHNRTPLSDKHDLDECRSPVITAERFYSSRTPETKLCSAKRSLLSPVFPDRSKKLKSCGESDISWKPVTRQSSSSVTQLKGFSNIGNTCYMNAILQTLFGLESFAKELFKSYLHFNSHIPNDLLLNNLPKLLGCKDSENQNLKDDLLRNIKNAISSTATRFSGYSQHDAHEFLAQVLDQLKEEINKMGQSQVIAAPLPPNPVQSNFEFTVCHYIHCQSCNNVLHKEEQFHDLSLDLPITHESNDHLLSLQTLLEAFFNEELVSFKCEHCKGNSAIIRHKFLNLPRVLTLHLKRYSYDSAIASNMKIANTIAIPRYLTLNRLCAENVTSVLLTASTKKISTKLLTPPSAESHSITTGVNTREKAKRRLYASMQPHDSTFRSLKVDNAGSPTNAHNSSFIDLHSTSDDDKEDNDYKERKSVSDMTFLGHNGLLYLFKLLAEEIHSALERSRHDVRYVNEEDERSFDLLMEKTLQQSLLEANAGSSAYGGTWEELSANDSNTTDDQKIAQLRKDESVEKDECSGDDDELKLNAEQGHLSPAFRLCGIVNHLGSGASTGHYVSDVWDRKASQWRSYDDSQVTEISEADVRRGRQKTAYILFYMAKNVLDDIC